MNDKFDELAKGMAQSVTRRGALKKFGVGLAGIAIASLGLANKAQADPKLPQGHCNHCVYPYGCETAPNPQACVDECIGKCYHKPGGGGY